MPDELNDTSLIVHDNSPTLSNSSESEAKPLLQLIDKRISEANEPRDIVLWTKVREEVIRQNETMEEAKHRRRLADRQLYFKMSFSIAVFATGIMLLVKGFIYLAPLIIGAGLFVLAPEFVMAYLTKDKGDQNE